VIELTGEIRALRAQKIIPALPRGVSKKSKPEVKDEVKERKTDRPAVASEPPVPDVFREETEIEPDRIGDEIGDETEVEGDRITYDYTAHVETVSRARDVIYGLYTSLENEKPETLELGYEALVSALDVLVELRNSYEKLGMGD
jgi:hypothetical protein